ncbi:MAG: hypothetical protein Q4A39_03505 [Eubacteriales bacterium]|nr:hypothetical protein [Eubacteriales bacterium]
MADIIYKRRFGDRKEGRQIHSLPAYQKITAYIMVKRNDACNQFRDSIEVTEIDRYLRAKRAEGWKGMGMLHLFLAAYIRTVSQRPGINRFIGGQRIYARREILINMVVKRGFSSDGTDTTIKLHFEPTDTIFDVYRKLNEQVDEIKADAGDNNTEKVANTLFRLPGPLLKFAVWLLTLMDYFDLLPKSLLAASPFHGSMIVTDLGSLGIPPIYHHLYNFGNLPVFLSFGAKRRAIELNAEGQPVERKYVDYTVVTDERICDGYYYASAFKHLKSYLMHPDTLEFPPEKVEDDIF